MIKVKKHKGKKEEGAEEKGKGGKGAKGAKGKGKKWRRPAAFDQLNSTGWIPNSLWSLEETEYAYKILLM